jgi:hypothetical protein
LGGTPMVMMIRKKSEGSVRYGIIIIILQDLMLFLLSWLCSFDTPSDPVFEIRSHAASFSVCISAAECFLTKWISFPLTHLFARRSKWLHWRKEGWSSGIDFLVGIFTFISRRFHNHSQTVKLNRQTYWLHLPLFAVDVRDFRNSLSVCLSLSVVPVLPTTNKLQFGPCFCHKIRFSCWSPNKKEWEGGGCSRREVLW